MTEFGHEIITGRGIFGDAWGAGPFVLVAGGRRYVFEDSDRFGPELVNPKTGDPTNAEIPENSPFWKVWERWRVEGRETQSGKPLGTRSSPVNVLYCVHSSIRRKRPING